MPRSNNPYHLHDTTLLTGWLFADLLLGLMVIFLVAVPRIIPPLPAPPVLIVDPASLDPTSANCKGGITNPQCTVTLSEAASSQGNMTWTASSDMSNAINFTPATSTLLPGQAVKVTISAIPCQNGSITFSGSRGARPVTVPWHCTAPPNDRILEHNYCRIQLNINAPNVFIADDINSARNIIEPQINQIQFLQGRQVGIGIAYGGSIGGSEDQGVQVASQVYNVLKALAKDQRAQMYTVFKTSSWYESLFTGFESSNTAIINVYLVVRPGTPKDTCDTQHHPIA